MRLHPIRSLVLVLPLALAAPAGASAQQAPAPAHPQPAEAPHAGPVTASAEAPPAAAPAKAPKPTEAAPAPAHPTAPDPAHHAIHQAGHVAGASDHHSSPIESSRPGLAEYTGVVARGAVQVEAGYSTVRLAEESRHALGEARVRYGLGLRSELRLNLNSFVLARDHGHAERGFEDTSLGLKTQLLRGRELSAMPSASVQLGGTLPTGSPHFGRAHWQPRAGLSLGWRLPDHLAVTTTAQYDRLEDHGHAVAQLTTATALSLPLSHHVHTHAEYAAIGTTAHWAERMHHVSGGLGFHLSEDVQLDLWTGGATHHGKREFLFGAGFSRRW